jgi:hypothetical protein
MRKREGRGRPRANHIQGGNLRAAWRPLAAYFAAVRRALAPAVGPRTCCSRFFLIRSRRGHGTHASAKNWDSNAVLCGTWQIPAANTRAPSLLSWPTRRGKESGSKLSASALLRLGLPQCPAAASGPRQARKRNGTADRGDAIRNLRRLDESTRAIETKIEWPFGRKCPGLPRLSRRLATTRQPNGGYHPPNLTLRPILTVWTVASQTARTARRRWCRS